MRDVLPDFRGGSIVIGVLGGFFKCPPAPYEAAFMLHDLLTRRGLREATTLQIVTPMPAPIPISPEVSAGVARRCSTSAASGTRPSPGSSALDPATRVAHLRDGREIPFDLFLGVPVHVAPPVVVESGLTEEDGWIAVDPATLETRFPGVYAVGDVASVPVPRAGVIAEGEAATLADVLVHRLGDGPEPARSAAGSPATWRWATTPSAWSRSTSSPAPRPVATFTPPSHEGAEAKRTFASARRRRWFGLDG